MCIRDRSISKWSVSSLKTSVFISTPPALAVTCNASVPVPVDDNIRLASFAPVTAIVKSSASAVDANVKLDGAPLASKLIPPPSSQSTVNPPVPKFTSKAVAPVELPTVIVLAAAPVPVSYTHLTLPTTPYV